MNQPLVSVAIPVYNGGEYFEKCLESVLNQTYQNWECVINNNQSKDNTQNPRLQSLGIAAGRQCQSKEIQGVHAGYRTATTHLPSSC